MQNKPTLVILAAGMASRYGRGTKQIEAFGPAGETIMEYSIYDAIKAGFKRVVFIIREEFAKPFKESIEPKLKGKIDTLYVYQHMEDFLGNHKVPADRKKPFGTAHALLCCKDVIKNPFAVINADDFYGLHAFQQAADFLRDEIHPNYYASIGYRLGNTLSENGSVTRGEIITDGDDNISHIIERKKIFDRGGHAIFTDAEGNESELPLDTKVSMNFFCFDKAYIDWLEDQYRDFLDKKIDDPSAEFLIPETTDLLIKSGKGKVTMIPTHSKWFGVTYEQDAPIVKKKFKELADKGQYPFDLWA